MELGIYCGSANRGLAEEIAKKLNRPLGRRVLKRFPDGEIYCQLEESVRGRDIYIVQSTCTPVNEHLMELLIMIDAFHRASAGRITAVIPYFGYSRQDRMTTGREPITARMVADLLTEVKVNRVISIDLHNAAIQGFFGIWMDPLTAVPLLAKELLNVRSSDAVIVSPDAGRVKMADDYARLLHLPLVVLHKRREGREVQDVRVVVGEIRRKTPIIIDDMISTGTTIYESVQALLKAGARPVCYVASTHPVFVGPVMERLEHEAIAQVTVTDTIPIRKDQRLDKVKVVSIADVLADAIGRLNRDESISELLRTV
ncbi:MAG: ribose-phosphate diphosphokinase [Chloroflexi bacterium]|nr:ribose-phosphate diphosphokinase [Chloroflexota bacterium]